MKPIAIDLYCGLGGWTEGLLAEGYYVVGFDIERHVYGEHRYPAQLVLQDVLTLHGKQFKDVALIVASPPCQAYSYRAMPWKRAKALPPPSNELFDACFRIQREACEAAGHHIPLVVENVKGAQKWVGRARWNFGSFYLWGDVPALMPMAVRRGVKVGGITFNGYGTLGYKPVAFNGTAENRLREEIKNSGGSWFKIGSPGQKEMNRNPVHKLAGIKYPGISGIRSNGKGDRWFQEGAAKHGSKSKARKAASAMIAKIPFILAQHIARTFHPANAKAAPST